MGAISTIRVTRRAALRFAVNQIMQASEHDLEAVCDLFLADRLYNVYLLPDDAVENDDSIID